MVSVFSFSLYGSADKYCKGMLRNVELIHESFPDWEIWIAVGTGVPDSIIQELQNYSFVKLRFTNETGHVNMSYRFFPIDNPTVDVMCVRDADSRVFARDVSCVRDFVQSEKLFHIVRDHPNHHHTIMGCSFGIKKGLLNRPLEEIFQEYRQQRSVTEFWNDMEFISAVFYPYVLSVSMIHDDLQRFESPSMKTRFKVSVGDGLHFIGQVYEFDENGKEYPKYTDFFEGGVHGKGFWTEERLQRIQNY